MGIRYRRSFTLIEMVIVIGVLGFALPILFAIIFIIIQQQGRIYALQQVKKEGDFAFNSMKSTIRQYGQIVVDPAIDTSPYPTYNPCPVLPNDTPTPASSLFLHDKANRDFSYILRDEKIASGSVDNNIDQDLTDSSVKIYNLQFSCYRTNQFSPPIINASFTVVATPGASLDYAARFQLKSY